MKINKPWCRETRSLFKEITAEAFHWVCKFKKEIPEYKCLLHKSILSSRSNYFLSLQSKSNFIVFDIISWWLNSFFSFSRFKKAPFVFSYMWCFSRKIQGESILCRAWESILIAIKAGKCLANRIFISVPFFEVTVIYSFKI